MFISSPFHTHHITSMEASTDAGNSPPVSWGRKNILLHDLFPQMISEAPPVLVPTVRYTPAVSLCAVTNTTKLRSAHHCHGLHCDGDLPRFVKTFMIKRTNSRKENHISRQFQPCEEGSGCHLRAISGPSRRP